jgi:hypothetical protein
MKKIICFLALTLGFFSAYSQSKIKLNPSIEIGIAQRSNPFELSPDTRYQGYSRITYQYDRNKHFRNFSISLAIQQFVLKKRISVQIASYLRYNHLYYGKNAQGVSSTKEKEYKRLKYDLFIDGIYHFKKRKTSSIGIELGLGIGYMNLGTRFKDSLLDYNNQYRETVGGFDFLAPRLIVGLNKNKFSFFAIAHGTPDSDYRSNPSVWLEFKLAYSFSLFKKKKIN